MTSTRTSTRTSTSTSASTSTTRPTIDAFRPDAGDHMPAPARRPWRRVVLPLAILAGSGWLLLDAGWSAWRPRTEVRASPVTIRTIEVTATDPSSSSAEDRAVIVQAPGWVEAAPDATYVSALTGGVVEEILVLEGDTVAAGDPVARLVTDDARIALERARADLHAREAALAKAEAVVVATETALHELVDLDRRVSIAAAESARLAAVLAGFPARIAILESTRHEIRDELDRKRRLVADGAVAEGPVIRLGFRLSGVEAQLDALRLEQSAAAAQLEAAEAEVRAASRHRDLLIEERRAASVAAAERDAAAAALAMAQADLDAAALRLDRCTIRTPVAGVVIERLTTAGSNLSPGPPQHSAHVVHIYDPENLQVRADVPLADAARIGVGQPAEVVVDLLPDTVFRGEIVRFVHRADLAKNTVEAKVRILDPSPLLKPDMLARVRLLAAPETTGAAGGADTAVARTASRVFAPRDALLDDATVWVLTERDGRDGIAVRRTVETGRAIVDDWIEIRRGLMPGDLVLLDHELHDGDPVRITEGSDA